jgi:hypothetical protein
VLNYFKYIFGATIILNLKQTLNCMKSAVKLTGLFLFISLLTSCWTKLGDFTVMSNRSIDSNIEYTELSRGIKAVGRQKKKQAGALDVALENMLKQVPGGEFVKNIEVQITWGGKYVKVFGDVWGAKKPEGEATNVKGFQVGDRVQFGKKLGTILSLIDNTFCLVQLDGDAAGTKLRYENLIRIDKKD